MTATATTETTATETTATETVTLGSLVDEVRGLAKSLDGLGKAANPGDAAAKMGQRAPWGTTGPVGEDSRGYSIAKMARRSMGYTADDSCKDEVNISQRLRDVYAKGAFPFANDGPHSWLVPFSSQHIPTQCKEGEKLAVECREKMLGGDVGRHFDPDQVRWAAMKSLTGDALQKTLGTLNDLAGGSFVPGPGFGELIDLQRNMEIFSRLGVRDIPLPPQGRISFPKQTGAGTFYMVGQASAITESTQATGSLLLQAKKGACLSVLNDEFLKFAGLAGEAFVRADLAAVAARGWDAQQLTGIGGDNEILGLLNYATTGVDPLTTHVGTAKDVPANGNTGYLFLPEDMVTMESELPDAVDRPTAWLMRKNLWGYIDTRRNDAVTAADAKGAFTINPFRTNTAASGFSMNGVPVVRSNGMPVNRVRGSATNLTAVILAQWSEWIQARAGVAEFLSNSLATTYYTQVQTGIRMVQYMDAGARHAASFNLFDQVRVA